MIRRLASTPSFWSVQLGGWGLYALLLIVTFLPISAADGEMRLVLAKGSRAAYGLLITSLMRLCYRPLFPGTFRRQAIGSVVASALFGGLWMALGELWATWYYSEHYRWMEHTRSYPRYALDHAVTLLGWSGLYFGIKHARAWQRERERALRADTLAQEARVASLRHQMHPHFLFNALTSVRALIGEDPARARRMVTEMADFLRFSLQKGDAPQVPLEEELAMVRSYLSIESVRFEEKLDVRVSVMPGTETLAVPAFLIQPLVDNAVKHGMASGELPVRVRVDVARVRDVLRIQVANSGRWAPPANTPEPQGTGTGLRNVRERLAQLFQDRARLSSEEKDGWVHITIDLPAVAWSPITPEESHDVPVARLAGG